MSPSTGRYRSSPTSRKPMTPRSSWRLRRRLRAGWTAPQSATGCAVGGSPGMVVSAGPHGVAEALRILAGGGEIDYEGASGGMEWDGNGDLRRGHIGIWCFTEDERIEEVRAVASRNEVAGFDVTREPNGFRVSAVAADLADRKTEMR